VLLIVDMSTQSEIKNALERLQFDTNQVLHYLQNIINKEISIDNSNTFIVDYSQYNFLRDNPQIKKQIENDSYLAFKARIRDDFVEFCRCISLQLEILTDYFCKLDSNTNEAPYLKKRIKPFLDKVCNDELDDKYKDAIYRIIDLRNIASHRDTSDLPIEEQIAKQENAVHLFISNLKQEEKTKMEEDLKSIINYNSNWDVKVYYKNRRFAFVHILNIDINSNKDKVIEQVRKNIRSISERISNNKDVKINLHKDYKDGASNKLNDFFKKSDYRETQDILLTLFEYFDIFIDQYHHNN